MFNLIIEGIICSLESTDLDFRVDTIKIWLRKAKTARSKKQLRARLNLALKKCNKMMSEVRSQEDLEIATDARNRINIMITTIDHMEELD